MYICMCVRVRVYTYMHKKATFGLSASGPLYPDPTSFSTQHLSTRYHVKGLETCQPRVWKQRLFLVPNIIRNIFIFHHFWPLPWTPRNRSPFILCCDDWLRLIEKSAYYSSLIQFLGCGLAIFGNSCPRKFQLSSSCKKQISRSAYYSLCSWSLKYRACFQAFVGSWGWCCLFFFSNFSQNAFWTQICGLILGPCFCRNPFLFQNSLKTASKLTTFNTALDS